MTKMQGTEKQIVFAAKIREALLRRLIATKMVAADKIEDFAAALDANSSSDAHVWIETAYDLAAGRDIISGDGVLGIDPRKYLPLIAIK